MRRAPKLDKCVQTCPDYEYLETFTFETLKSELRVRRRMVGRAKHDCIIGLLDAYNDAQRMTQL